MDDLDAELLGIDTSQQDKGGNTQIQVFARIRPSKNAAKSQYMLEDGKKLTVKHAHAAAAHSVSSSNDYVNNTKDQYEYTFAGILDESSKQEDVFETIAKPAIQNCMEGYNSTIFAYGQTGSGKTYTITGGTSKYEDRGILPRTLEHIYHTIQNRSDQLYSVKISYLEVYNENGYDLLHPEHDSKSIDDLPKVTIYENGSGEFVPTNLYAFPAATLEDALNLLFVGDTNRIVCETPSNDASTRSHCIFTIQLESREVNGSKVRRSKLNLVDLAGSERIKKTGVSGKIEREARYINLSLHYLEQLIVALHHLSQGKSTHLPYRNSMMTMMLRDSLGGNCKTIMIATFSMQLQHVEETVSTARFAQRVAMIKNFVIQNESIDPSLLIKRLKTIVREQRDELQMLRGQSVADKQQLSEDELQRLRELVGQYISQSSPPALTVAGAASSGGSSVRLHSLAPYKVATCFQLMKQMVLAAANSNGDTKPNVQQLLNSAVTSTGAAQPMADAAGSAASEEIKKLRMLVQHRDKEIAVLVSMLKSQENGAAASAAPTNNRVFSNATDPALLARQQQALQHMQANSSLSSPANSALQSNASPPDAELLRGRAEAFESFRRSYRKNEVIEESKAALAVKYSEAKRRAEDINNARNNINQLKALLEQHRVEQGVASQLVNGQMSDDSSEPTAEEQRIRQQMEAEKQIYRSEFSQLKALKTEIEHDQQMLERSRRQLQQDFDTYWNQHHQGQAAQTASTPKAVPAPAATSSHSVHQRSTSLSMSDRPSSSASTRSNRLTSPLPDNHLLPLASITNQPQQIQPKPIANGFTPAPLYPTMYHSASKSSLPSTTGPLPPSAIAGAVLGSTQRSMQHSYTTSSRQSSPSLASGQHSPSVSPLPSTGNAQADADIAAFYRMRDALLASTAANRAAQ